MNDLATPDRPRVAKNQSLGRRRIRHGTSSLVALLLISMVVPLGVAASVVVVGSTGAAASSARNASSDALTAPGATAGLQSLPNVPLAAVSCISKHLCLAVGSEGGFGRDPGTEGTFVQITNGIPGTVQLVPSIYALVGVDCVNATTCYAVGNGPYSEPGVETPPGNTEGVVVIIDNGAVTGISSIPSPSNVLSQSGYSYLYGIGCESAATCLAVGYNSYPGGNAYRVRNGVAGTTPIPTGQGNANGIECVGEWCKINAETNAEGQGGEVEPVQLGQGKKTKITHYLGGSELVYGGDCHPGDFEFCLTAGAQGSPGEGALTFTGNWPTTVTKVAGTSVLKDVGCVDNFWCVAVGTTTSGEGVRVPVVSKSPRTPIAVAGSSSLSGVSCVSNGLCVAVGTGPSSSGVIDSFEITR
jgi:hypothetical protein